MTARLYNIATERAKRRSVVTAWDLYLSFWMFWLGGMR
jgi:hypothetical protein